LNATYTITAVGTTTITVTSATSVTESEPAAAQMICEFIDGAGSVTFAAHELQLLFGFQFLFLNLVKSGALAGLGHARSTSTLTVRRLDEYVQAAEGHVQLYASSGFEDGLHDAFLDLTIP
jgi:hypothetical protein